MFLLYRLGHVKPYYLYLGRVCSTRQLYVESLTMPRCRAPRGQPRKIFGREKVFKFSKITKSLSGAEQRAWARFDRG